MLESAWWLCHLKAGWALGGSGCTWGWGGREDECEQTHATIAMQWKNLYGCILLPHQEEETYSGQKECVALYPDYIIKLWFWCLHLHLYSNLISILSLKLRTQALILLTVFSRVVLLMGQNRTSIHLFPVRIFSEMTGFSQLASRSSWERYWKNSNWISLRNQVPRFQWLNVVSGLLEI